MAEQDILSEPAAFDHLYQQHGSRIRNFLRLSLAARGVTPGNLGAAIAMPGAAEGASPPLHKFAKRGRTRRTHPQGNSEDENDENSPLLPIAKLS
ncbi:MAG: hypothetical protein ACRD4O_05500, partial [Bryobacteraceae bacterium]